MDNQAKTMIEAATAPKQTVSYEQWYRQKEHQQKLREVLTLEAKRDLYEKLLKK